jgi:cytochrome c-type biogenesis protein
MRRSPSARRHKNGNPESPLTDFRWSFFRFKQEQQKIIRQFFSFEDSLPVMDSKKEFIFLTDYCIVNAMQQPQDVSVLIAFSAGLLSFASPCVLPLVPSYITYITGVSFKDLSEGESGRRLRWLTISHSLLFILGFSLIFVLMGASASYLGQVLIQYQSWIMKVGGVLIIILGIHFTGLVSIPFLQMERRFELKKKPMGYFGSFLVGIVFAAGWTPCVGPILSTILLYASTAKNFSTGIVLLAAYSMGLGLPFFVASLAFNTFLSAFEKIKRYMRVIMLVSGIFMILIGVLLITDLYSTLNNYLNILANP